MVSSMADFVRERMAFRKGMRKATFPAMFAAGWKMAQRRENLILRIICKGGPVIEGTGPLPIIGSFMEFVSVGYGWGYGKRIEWVAVLRPKPGRIISDNRLQRTK